MSLGVVRICKVQSQVSHRSGTGVALAGHRLGYIDYCLRKKEKSFFL